MINFGKTLSIISRLTLAGLLSYSTLSYAAETSFHCETTNQCNSAAQICGQIAGVETGRNVCLSKTEAPHPDFMWQREVKFLHCMGYLPIIATLNDDVLYNLFITSYQNGYASSFKAAGCQ